MVVRNNNVELVTELISSGVPISRVKELFKDRISEGELGNVIFLHESRGEHGEHHSIRSANSRGCDGSRVSAAITPDIKRLVEGAKVPEEFLDPLHLQLMKDPVAISSGHIVDRSTILDRDGNLRFTRCPFSGEQLNAYVYPVEQKKEQIENFQMKRKSNITKISRKLIDEGKFESFHEVLDVVEIYLKGLGENYLPLMRELAAIWSGTRNPPSTMLHIDQLKIKPSNQWVTAVESERIEEKVYKILVSIEKFRDEGRSSHITSHKSYLALSLYNDTGELVERCKLFDNPINMKSSSHCIFGFQDKIVANARPGYTYKLQYVIGSSPQYVEVEGLFCKILPRNATVSSYQMQGADGEQGLYIGPTNLEGNAHGEGTLEYNDGKTFVGKFQDGSMVDGVLYHGSYIRQTLKRGQWTKSIDYLTVEKYPSNMIVYNHSWGVTKPRAGCYIYTKDLDISSSQKDKEFVLKKVEEYGGQALKFAHDALKRDKNFLLNAMKLDSDALQYAHISLKKDRDFISLAVEGNGRCLKYASDDLKQDRDIVLKAVNNTPSSLQYSLGGLDRDEEVLKVSNLWNTDCDEMSELPLLYQSRVVMSTCFALGGDSTPQAIIFGALIREHPFFASFLIYHPSVWNIRTWDKKWTKNGHSPRGTFDTCLKKEDLKEGQLKEEESHWRYSYRCQLENALKAKIGFVIQLVEVDKDHPECHMLGDGQFIELELASKVGIKIFQVFQPVDVDGWDENYSMDDVENLIDAIKEWLSKDCVDKSIARVGHFRDNNIELRSNISRIPAILEKIQS